MNDSKVPDGWKGQSEEAINERVGAAPGTARFVAVDAAEIEVGDEVYVEQDSNPLAHGIVVARENEAGRIGLTIAPGYGESDAEHDKSTEVWDETGRTFTRVERPDVPMAEQFEHISSIVPQSLSRVFKPIHAESETAVAVASNDAGEQFLLIRDGDGTAGVVDLAEMCAEQAE
jgi:hypothetical protein